MSSSKGRWSACGPGVQPGPSRPCTVGAAEGAGSGRGEAGWHGRERKITGQAMEWYLPSLGHGLGFSRGALELGLGCPSPSPDRCNLSLSKPHGDAELLGTFPALPRPHFGVRRSTQQLLPPQNAQQSPLPPPHPFGAAAC